VINAYKILIGKPQEKRLLQTLKRRWEYNIKMDLIETVTEDVEWLKVVQDRLQHKGLVNTEMNPQTV
jgi:hypothetical protein